MASNFILEAIHNSYDNQKKVIESLIFFSYIGTSTGWCAQMKRYLLGIYSLISLLPSNLKAQQVISQPGIEVFIATPDSNPTVNPNGVEFTNQVVGNSATVLVEGGYTVNGNGNQSAVSTTVSNTGIVSFQGANNSGPSLVIGEMGNSTNYLESILVDQNDVIIQNRLFAENVIFNGPASITEEGNWFLGAGGVLFNDPEGVLIMAENTRLTGSVNGNLAAGNLRMNKNTTVTGNVSVFDLRYTSRNEVGNRIGTIDGNLTVQNVNTEEGGFFVGGNLTLGAGASIVSQGAGILANGTLTLNGFVDIQINFDLLKAPRSPNSQFVFIEGAAGGTSGQTINVRTNDIRVDLVGINDDPGVIIVQSSTLGEKEPPEIPEPPEQRWWLKLIPGTDADTVTEGMLVALPVAYDYPGSDLDFIEGQIGSPTVEGYLNNLYQLYPVPALLGVAQESFNTMKQFQKVWLKDLYRHRSGCRYDCRNECEEGTNVWTDGFGYFGHHSNSLPGQGYNVNTWGTTIAADKQIRENLWLGVGFGYAYSDLRKCQFVVKTPHVNKTKINYYQGTVYGNYSAPCWFLDGGFSFSVNNYVGTRYIHLPNTDRKAHSNHLGYQYTAFLTAGYEACIRQFQVTPFALLNASYLCQDAYQESGAKVLNLKIKQQTHKFLESGLGLKLARLFETSCGSFLPEVHAIWLHQFKNGVVNVASSFSGLASKAGYWQKYGPEIDKNFWNVGASVTCLKVNCASILLDYEYEWSNKYYDHQGMVSFNYMF